MPPSDPVDVGVSWLNPSRSKHIEVRAGEKFMEDVEKLKYRVLPTLES